MWGCEPAAYVPRPMGCRLCAVGYAMGYSRWPTTEPPWLAFCYFSRTIQIFVGTELFTSHLRSKSRRVTNLLPWGLVKLKKTYLPHHTLCEAIHPSGRSSLELAIGRENVHFVFVPHVPHRHADFCVRRNLAGGS